MGTRDHGLILIDTKTLSFRDVTSLLGDENHSDRVIMSLYRGSSGIIWAGTRYNGAFKIVPRTKSFIRPVVKLNDQNLNHGVISCFTMDHEGNKWFGIRNEGLVRIDGKTAHVRNYRAGENSPNALSNNTILSICPSVESGKTILWIGTDGGGLNKLDPVTGTCIQYKKNPDDRNSLSNDHIYSILDLDADHLLIGTWGISTSGGLDLFNKKNGRCINFNCLPDDPASLNSRIVLKLFRDREGIIWIGTRGGGLSKMMIRNINASVPEEIASFVTFRNIFGQANSLSHNDVYSIYEDKSGTLWVGTGGGGLNRFDRIHESFRSFSRDDGFNDDMIYNILEDKYNVLWLSTSNGIIKFNPKTETIRNYVKTDGLPHNEFSPGSAFKSPSGELCVGGVNGFISFYPDSIRENLNIPEIAITAFAISGKGKSYNARDYTGVSLNYLNKVELPHSLNDLSFEFASLDYSAPEKNMYKYRLSGYHEEWTYTNSRPEICFLYQSSAGPVYLYRERIE